MAEVLSNAVMSSLVTRKHFSPSGVNVQTSAASDVDLGLRDLQGIGGMV